MAVHYLYANAITSYTLMVTNNFHVFLGKKSIICEENKAKLIIKHGRVATILRVVMEDHNVHVQTEIS